MCDHLFQSPQETLQLDHFSHSVVFHSFQPQGLQYARPPCPSQTPGVTQTHVHWVGDAIQPSHPLSSPSPNTFNLSQHQVFSSDSVLWIRWPQYWTFSISPSNEYSGLISFRLDWMNLLAVQGTSLRRLPKNLLNTTLQKHQFFGAQLSL